MVRYKFITILLCIITSGGNAQQSFLIKDGSQKYIAAITVEGCKDNTCEGKGTIKLIDKNTNKVMQVFTSDDLYFYLDSNFKPSVNVIELYDEQSPLIFKDFNFDRAEDLAIRNGNSGSYGGPSYDVYVFNSTKKQFVISNVLTNLANENLGMFQTDAKRKRLSTFAKSGCCWHITTDYKVVPNKGLQKVYELEENALDGEFVIVTERNLINNKWVSKTKKYKIDDYYKN